jgi:amidophosphoribosyltransferase
MGGFFGVVSTGDCASDLFYGTDYHCHLGTRRGGLATFDSDKFTRFIHDITNSQFRSKFETDIARLAGATGIGVISDNEDQPLLIASHLGSYAIATVGKIVNLKQLSAAALGRSAHFSEMGCGEINPTEVVATLVNQGKSFEEGLAIAQEAIIGSCSILLLTPQGIYAARDRFGRTPIVVGKRAGDYAVSMETSAFHNLYYEVHRYLGPGEIVRVTAEGVEQLRQPGKKLRICAFLWVYYGYPASSYEGINVELSRNRSGAALARRDTAKVDLVAGIPDSGTGHAIGYANQAGVPYGRPFVKYTPTWARSFMPQDQTIRNLVAKMKLIPIRELIEGQRLLFCEDSIVRGTQLRDLIGRLYDLGAKEVHMRPACPPLVYPCPFLNFSQSKSELDLAARRVIRESTNGAAVNLADYEDPDSPKYVAMVDQIRQQLNLTTLQYQRIDDMVEAIGLPREKLCTYCWNAVGDEGTLAKCGG